MIKWRVTVTLASLVLSSSFLVSAAQRKNPEEETCGGYTTQFILYNGSTDQASSGSLRFLNQAGQTLSLSVR